MLRTVAVAVVLACLPVTRTALAQDAAAVAPKVPGENGIIRLSDADRPGVVRPGDGPPGTISEPMSPGSVAPMEVSRNDNSERPGVARPGSTSEPMRPGVARPGSKGEPVRPGAVQPGTSASGQANENTQLLPALQGLVFVSSQDHVKKSGVSGVQGVEANTKDILATPAFNKVADKYIGKPVTLKTLKELNHDVVAFYARHDFPVVDVVIPAQDITSGDIQVVVLKGHLEAVRAEGNKHFSDKLLLSEVRLHKGAVIRQSKVAENISWLNRNPFRHVDLVYARGNEPGGTDVILRTRDRFPLRIYGGYEDSGNKYTGDNRWNLGFNWGNVFGLDQQLNYQYTFNNATSLFNAHSGTYIVPLPWHNIFSVFGSYVTTSVKPGTLPGGLTKLNLRGRSYQLSPRYTIPLPRIPFKGLRDLTHEFTVGYDFKRSNNNLEFGGTQVLSSEADISQMVFRYSAEMPDLWGRTSFVASTYWSPGRMTHFNKDANFEKFHYRASADYVYARFEAERVQRLYKDFTLFGKVTGQISNENLLGSEQLGAGGYATVRGYEERAVNADEGYIVNFELRTPTISPSKVLHLPTDLGDQLQFLLFYDYAYLFDHTVKPQQPSNYILDSFGPGIRYTIPPYLTVRFDYGFQLRDPRVGPEADRHRASRMDLGILLSY